MTVKEGGRCVQLKKTRQNTEREKEQNFRSILDYYRLCRGLTITELAMLAGLKRQMVSELCDGERIKPKYIECLAKALHVEISDLNQSWRPDEMLGNRVRVDELTEEIDKVVDALKPCQLKGKARWIAAYLATEDKNFQAVMDYLLCCANTMGLITLHQYLLENFGEPGGELPDIPEPYGKKNQRKYYEAAADERETMTNLARYMKYRDKNVDQVASGAGLTRQTVGAARKGRKSLSKKNLAKVAECLHVDSRDLTEDGCGWVPISLEKEKLHAAINVCCPHNLERKMNHVRRWLEDWRDGDADYALLTEILKFLLGETDEGRRELMVEGLLEIRNKPVVRKYLRKDRPALIDIGYQAVEGSEDEYEAFVLLDPWFYAFFDVDSPVEEMHIEEQALKFWRGEKKGKFTGIDMPITFSVSGRENYAEDELEEAAVDAVHEYLLGLDVNPEREELYRRCFDELLEWDILHNCTVNKFVGDDALEKVCEKRIRNIRYEHVLRKLYQMTVGDWGTKGRGDDADLFMSMAAALFSSIVTEPETEKEKLSMYLS